MTLLERINSPADLRQLSMDDLIALAGEIRTAIVDQVSQSGGHLAPNLGVVELTIALHYVFDFAHDRLLFDVGHQCYPHKLLTGRLNMLAHLRTRQGMAGFPEPKESAYDLFSVGHAGTAISTAVGMARGDTLNNEAFDAKSNPTGRRVVSLIGDASIVNGVAMEGLNNAGTLDRQFLVVLNDNGMSISKPQGAIAQYFDRVRVNPVYSGAKTRAKHALEAIPGGGAIRSAYHRLTEALKGSNTWFEHFGLLTIGPIDGHDLPELIEFLTQVKDVDRPLVLHAKTIKGKGLEYAEKDATTFHSPAAHTYDPDSCRVEIRDGGRSFTSAFGDAMCDLMERDEQVVACTAAMPNGTGIDQVLDQFPTRAFDTGICESHAMDMMAGLAKTGLKPFFAVYSTFLQRAFDQAFQEVALQGLPVRLCLDRAGLVGGDGAVHQGFCDVAILRTLPGAVLTAAIDETSLRAALEFMRTYDTGLSAVRYPRDTVSAVLAAKPCPDFELGRARALLEHDEKPDLVVLGFGTPTIAALEAARQVAPEVRADVYDARFAKPIDTELLRRIAALGVPVVTIEDHGIQGGFGSAILEAAADLALPLRVTRLGMPDAWIAQNSRAQQLKEVGLDAASIARTLIRVAAGQEPASSAVTTVVRTGDGARERQG
ncbi:MAG: 1-deoxy-D-xylulose-5-phosphate synthase [Phycisphaerales bacterium]|nr:1-deoxy-D-xylulose-5-phosphate synthase [Phycisphaerales bacterium]